MTQSAPVAETPQKSPNRGGNSNGSGNGRGKSGWKPANRKTLQTWAFDSVGPRKYALQLQEASNGNPCLRIVEGKPQSDGTFRKFELTIWSEDFERLFETFDAVRGYINEHDVKTPPGHKYDPNAKCKGKGKGRGRGRGRGG